MRVGSLSLGHKLCHVYSQTMLPLITEQKGILERFTFTPGEKSHFPLLSGTSGISTVRIVGDGSSVADAHRAVETDRSEPAQRWRYVCPNSHTNWDCANNHIWCHGCRRQIEVGDDGVTREHWEIYHKQRDRSIRWLAVQLVHHKQTI